MSTDHATNDASKNDVPAVYYTLVFYIKGADECERRIPHCGPGTVLKIGNDPRSDLLLNEPGVTRIHAIIEFVSVTRIKITDLAGEQTTKVNNTPVTDGILHKGDFISVGAGEISFDDLILEEAPVFVLEASADGAQAEPGIDVEPAPEEPAFAAPAARVEVALELSATTAPRDPLAIPDDDEGPTMTMAPKAVKPAPAPAAPVVVAAPAATKPIASISSQLTPVMPPPKKADALDIPDDDEEVTKSPQPKAAATTTPAPKASAPAAAAPAAIGTMREPTAIVPKTPKTPLIKEKAAAGPDTAALDASPQIPTATSPGAGGKLPTGATLAQEQINFDLFMSDDFDRDTAAKKRSVDQQYMVDTEQLRMFILKERDLTVEATNANDTKRQENIRRARHLVVMELFARGVGVTLLGGDTLKEGLITRDLELFEAAVESYVDDEADPVRQKALKHARKPAADTLAALKSKKEQFQSPTRTGGTPVGTPKPQAAGQAAPVAVPVAVAVAVTVPPPDPQPAPQAAPAATAPKPPAAPAQTAPPPPPVQRRAPPPDPAPHAPRPALRLHWGWAAALVVIGLVAIIIVALSNRRGTDDSVATTASGGTHLMQGCHKVPVAGLYGAPTPKAERHGEPEINCQNGGTFRLISHTEAEVCNCEVSE